MLEVVAFLIVETLLICALIGAFDVTRNLDHYNEEMHNRNKKNRRS